MFVQANANKTLIRLGPRLTPARIKNQMERILSSPEFRAADRMKRFVRHIVDRAITGNGHELKEYTIALDVFDRDASFDPRINAHVRVEASRLRRRLKQYYLSEGLTDPVRIDLPRGSYTPTFIWRGTKQPKEVTTAPEDRQHQTKSWNCAAEPERRLVTIMTCHLGFPAESSTDIDDEQLFELTQFYSEAWSRAVEHHGGFIKSATIGHLMGCFGYPEAHDEDAERAVWAALDAIEGFRGPGNDRRTILAAGIGIATGRVVAGNGRAEEQSHHPIIVGDCIQTALQLSELAKPNTILVNPRTSDLVGNKFEFETLGPRELAGHHNRIHACRIKARRMIDSRCDAADPSDLTPFIGRQPELALLCDRWSRVLEGEAQAVSLWGDAGIGKSRLLRELRNRVAAGLCQHQLYQYDPHDRASPSESLAYLEHTVGILPEDDQQTRIEKLIERLDRPDDDVGRAAAMVQYLGSLHSGEPGCEPENDFGPQRDELVQKLVHHLVAVASTAPLLLVFEDVHWADQNSLEFVNLLLAAIPDYPVLLVVTCRSDFGNRWTHLPHLTSLQLTPLSKADTTEMIHAVSPERHLTAPARSAILDRVDGVPLFVEEVTKWALRPASNGSHAELEAGAIPDRLRQMLAPHFNRLDATPQRLLKTAASIGRQFSCGLLAELLDRPEDGLREQLDGLVEAGILLRCGMSPSRSYAFKYALFADMTYDSLLFSQRQHIHGKIAKVSEQKFPELAKTEPKPSAVPLFTRRPVVSSDILLPQGCGSALSSHVAQEQSAAGD